MAPFFLSWGTETYLCQLLWAGFPELFAFTNLKAHSVLILTLLLYPQDVRPAFSYALRNPQIVLKHTETLVLLDCGKPNPIVEFWNYGQVA